MKTKRQKQRLYRIHSILKKAGHGVLARAKTVYVRRVTDERLDSMLRELIDAGYGVTKDMFL